MRGWNVTAKSFEVLLKIMQITKTSQESLLPISLEEE
jgi:hypothetical protein